MTSINGSCTSALHRVFEDEEETEEKEENEGGRGKMGRLI